MNVLLDHLSSTLVFTSVAFLLATTQLRMQQDTASSTVAYMTKKHLLSFAELVEDEFQLMGEGISGTKIVSLTSDSEGRTTSFIFNREISSVDTQIEYRLVPTDTVDVRGVDIPIFRIDRYEAGNQLGGGPAFFSDFRVELLTSSGGAASTSTARVVRITLSLLHSLGNTETYRVNTSYWGMTLRPASLDT
ncbi:hypothetical protein JYT20_01430 [Rhodothermus sp. AH-315-K08]|nr:hypothetical protein [Rhodothermus sp. AH-315-K08]